MKNSTSASYLTETFTPSLPSDSMSIEEMLRIMDVASQFRQQKDRVEQEFRNDESQSELRKKLQDAAKVTGEEISESEINAAIDWYYDHLHTYKPPRMSIPLLFAHMYIRRTLVLSLLVGVGVLYLGYLFMT